MRPLHRRAPAESRDFDTRAFARLLARLPEHLPISDDYEGRYPQPNGRWWSSQREHMTSWFRAQSTTGSGASPRAKPNTSAKVTYNRLLCAEGLLWINEALGQDLARVQAAADEAGAEPNRRKRCAIIRRHLPWEEVAQLATGSGRGLAGGPFG